MEPFDAKKNREENKAKALEMQAKGLTVTQIAKELGINRQTARFLLDEKAYQRNLERCRQYDKAKRIRPKLSSPIKVVNRVPLDTVAARLAEIPKDTRSKTARLFGDPLPGRRALDHWRPA